jgi:hypothetical protein
MRPGSSNGADNDPVVAADGHTYERVEIAMWIRLKGDNVKSPKTNESLADTRLIPNHALKANIDEAVENAVYELRASRENGNCEGEGADWPIRGRYFAKRPRRTGDA